MRVAVPAIPCAAAKLPPYLAAFFAIHRSPTAHAYRPNLHPHGILAELAQRGRLG